MSDRTIIGSAAPLDLNSGLTTGEPDNISEINTPERPDSIALITAIEDSITEIATGKMTAIEVLGVLELVSKRFYDEHLQVDSF
jgi:hypothetical protein